MWSDLEDLSDDVVDDQEIRTGFVLESMRMEEN
jgi:hypothetical protein